MNTKPKPKVAVIRSDQVDQVRDALKHSEKMVLMFRQISQWQEEKAQYNKDQNTKIKSAFDALAALPAGGCGDVEAVKLTYRRWAMDSKSRVRFDHAVDHCNKQIGLDFGCLDSEIE